MSTSSSLRYKNMSILGPALSDDALLRELFSEWMLKHKRVYASPEEQMYRFYIFKDTACRVYAHNTTRIKSHTAGLTRFADRTLEERRRCCGLLVDPPISIVLPPPDMPLPPPYLTFFLETKDEACA